MTNQSWGGGGGGSGGSDVTRIAMTEDQVFELVLKWINELGIESNKPDWNPPFKFGYGQGLIAVMQKIDDFRRKQREASR
jgi:hypothetical protein